MRLTLVRHGQSVANAEERAQGQMDFPLSEQGIGEAQALGKWLAKTKIDVLYSSDLSRAYQTAKEIAPYHDLEIHTHEKLREFGLGNFQGLTRLEINEKYPHYVGLDWFTANIEGVEQMSDIQARGLSMLEYFRQNYPGQHVVAVSHGGFISSTLMALLKVEWRGKRVFAIGNTSMTTIDFTDPEHFIIVGVNETPHLV